MELKDAKVVYIDDNRFNIALIKAFAEEFGINLISFLNPKEGLDYVLKNDVDLILLDYMMPELNGIEFAKIVKAQKPDVPIIMITAFDDYKVRAAARKVGIDDFLPKPVNIESFEARIVEKIKKLEKKEKKETNIKLNDVDLYVLFSKICVSKDKSYESLIRVATISKIIASKIKDDEFVNKIYKAALFYDIGKNKIPSEILLKPSKLSREEFELVKAHTTFGYEMLNEGDEILQIAAIIALNHHEKYDGSGYPRKLKKDEIPLCARIVAIADVFDALVTKKVYRDKYPLIDAINYILKEKGKSFDPKLVDIFYQNIEEIRLLYL